jgi:hypothetical protein
MLISLACHMLRAFIERVWANDRRQVTALDALPPFSVRIAKPVSVLGWRRTGGSNERGVFREGGNRSEKR